MKIKAELRETNFSQNGNLFAFCAYSCGILGWNGMLSTEYEYAGYFD